MPPRTTISGVVPFLAAHAAAARGANPVELLRAAGLATDGPPRAEEHVAVERYFDVWRKVVTHVGDASFPVQVVAASHLEDSEVFGFLAMSCGTLGEAFERTSAFRALYCVGAQWEMAADAHSTTLTWQPWPGDRRDTGFQAAMDFAMADMAKAIRRLGQSAPAPVKVRIAHPAPPSTSAYAAHYGVKPAFGAGVYELVYAPGTTDSPVVTFNSKLRDYFDGECRRLLGELGTSVTTVARVRGKLIPAMGGGDTSIDKVAKALGMSTRSMQRQLADEGTSYNEVLTDVRAEFSKRYLARGTVSVSEVAYLVGFNEPAAFFKAFKRWTGVTPRAYQQSVAAG